MRAGGGVAQREISPRPSRAVPCRPPRATEDDRIEMSKSKPRKKNPKPAQRARAAWTALVPGGPGRIPMMSLEELRNVKEFHTLITEKFPGPPAVGYAIRSFRLLKLFAIANIVEDRYPPLTRCWKELERLFMREPALRDEFFVAAWILLNFPCGPERRTVLDHFEMFVEACNQRAQFDAFIGAVRNTRLGLYQQVMRSSTNARYRELFTDRVVDVHPSLEAGGAAEIVLARLVELEGQNYFFGDAKAFPAEARDTIEFMVDSKLFYLDDEAVIHGGRYEAFMTLAGPYWMSIVVQNEKLPILDPDHYRSYLRPA